MKSSSVSARLIVPLLWLGCVGTALALVGLTSGHAQQAHRSASAAEEALKGVARDAEEVVSLRAAVPDLSPDHETPGGLTPRVIASLHRAGVPDAALASLSPEAESQLSNRPGLRVSRRRATVTLGGVTLPQVGRFLDAWRSAEPAWTTTGIDLSPAAGSANETGGDQPLRAVIAIETTTVTHDGAEQ